MEDIEAQIRDYLTKNRLVTTGQLARADAQVKKENVSLAKALMDLQMLTPAAFGGCLSAVHQLPYRQLLNEAPQEAARNALSAECALRWKVFPADYDTEQHVLTYAIHDPAQMPAMERINKLFMLPHTLGFVIASEFEIEAAIRRHMTGEVPAPAKAAKPAEPAKPAPAEPRTPLKLTALREPGATVSVSAQQARKEQPEPTFTREEVGKSLIGAASLLASICLEKDVTRLDEVRERARYCQLLSARLGIAPLEVDKAVVAAWLSGLEERSQFVKQFVTPYELEKVLNPGDRAGTASCVLTLVRTYQEMKKKDPSACKDVNLARRNLRLQWSAPQECHGMLETFLQLLMDEEFLAQAGETGGGVLIVDPSEVANPVMTSAIASAGYEVRVMPSVAAAIEYIGKAAPQLIISEIELPQENGVKFCQRIKREEATSKIAFLAVMAQKAEKLAAECLRAGADAHLIKPINADVLLLTINNLLNRNRSTETKAGVSGSLEDMGFTDMIQILCSGSKSLEIVLSQGTREGSVFVKNGEIIHAVAGDKSGADAFFSLMNWKNGQFTARQCAEFPPRTINASTTSLLMTGAQMADEGTIGNEQSAG